jgi:putative tricarboxylic transport membrane protein
MTVRFYVHAPPGSPPWMMAEALVAAVAETGVDGREWQLVDTGAKPGIGAMEALAARPGDGDAIATCTPVYVQAPLLGKTAVTHRDLTPLARLVGDRYVIAVRDDGARDAAALLALIRAGGTRSGGYFAGGINHLLALAIADAARAPGAVQFVTVASEADLFPALLEGRLDWVCATAVEIATRAPAGRVRVVAVIAPERLPRFPDAPTLAACGAPLDFLLWRGVCGPGGLDAAACARWRATLAAARNTTAWRSYLATHGQAENVAESDAFAAFLDEEWNWYARQMAAAGVLPG